MCQNLYANFEKNTTTKFFYNLFFTNKNTLFKKNQLLNKALMAFQKLNEIFGSIVITIV